MGREVRLALRGLRDDLIHSFYSIDEETEAQRVEWKASSRVSGAEAPSRFRAFHDLPHPLGVSCPGPASAGECVERHPKEGSLCRGNAGAGPLASGKGLL